ncbi:hypothetical protein CASFOL_042750 [Castilleja foliolosa]|uniref:Homeobox domain-containing protein n=1 Tax=Castilleja foliolosa TaxID=1961234 RepID=A0ABD3B998_9LAMI
MEQQQQQHEQVVVAIDAGKSSTTSSNYNLSARQSSPRWSPTSEQKRILKELYYNYGVRSPSAEQIQRISAKLRQYGKIEGKNVFYWFQNHKARARQKKRSTSTTTTHHHQDHNHNNMNIISQPNTCSSIYYNNKNNNIIDYTVNSHLPSSSVPNYGYGSVAMEKSFRECSIGSGSTWIGFDPYASCFVDDQQKITAAADKTLEMEEEEQEEIETLALFPMHGDIIVKQQQQARPSSSDYNNLFNNPGDDDDHVAATSRASNLELTLNSYNIN